MRVLFLNEALSPCHMLSLLQWQSHSSYQNSGQSQVSMTGLNFVQLITHILDLMTQLDNASLFCKNIHILNCILWRYFKQNKNIFSSPVLAPILEHITQYDQLKCNLYFELWLGNKMQKSYFVLNSSGFKIRLSSVSETEPTLFSC